MSAGTFLDQIDDAVSDRLTDDSRRHSGPGRGGVDGGAFGGLHRLGD